MENQLVWFLCKNLYPREYTLMVQQIKEDLVRLVVISLDKIIIENSLRLGFSTTNNEVEYGSIGRDDNGSENGRKDSRDILRFKVGCRPSKGIVGGQGCEKARIFQLG